MLVFDKKYIPILASNRFLNVLEYVEEHPSKEVPILDIYNNVGPKAAFLAIRVLAVFEDKELYLSIIYHYFKNRDDNFLLSAITSYS